MTDSPTPSSPSTSSAGGTRYQCTACGNLTRFDVVSSSRTKSFHHYSVGGDLEVSEVEVLGGGVESVSCRWCDSDAAVEELPEP